MPDPHADPDAELPEPEPQGADRTARDAALDAAFAEIVAGWDTVPPDPLPRWPLAEDAPDAQPGRPPGGPRPPTPARPPGDGEPIHYASGHGLPTPPPVQPPPVGPRDWQAADEPEGHYVPPAPPPLPRGDLITQLCWAAVLVGPAFLLFAGLFWRSVGRLWLGLATVAFIGGFVALVSRLPQHRSDDEDDGAVL